MFVVYRITNTINGKSYIGFTSGSLLSRWRSHCYVARKGGGFYFHHAIRKYGIVNFKPEILEEGWDPKIGKDIREPYWISVLCPEYNMTAGGEGILGRTHSTETRERMSRSNLGKKRSAETCEKIRQSSKGKNLGKKHSLETRMKIGKKSLGRKHSIEARLKMSKLSRGRTHSHETRMKISRIVKGRIMSIETREKMRQSQLGRTASPETREKMRQAQLNFHEKQRFL